MSEFVEEDRLLRTDDGDGVSVPVSRVGPGRFRIESLFDFAGWWHEDVDVPEDAGVGWILEVDELEDGTLEVKRVVPDPTVYRMGGTLLPRHFSASPEFRAFGDRIVSLGGNWEVFAHGLFSAYVPKDRAQADGFDLEEGLQEAIQAWAGSSEGRIDRPRRWGRRGMTE